MGIDAIVGLVSLFGPKIIDLVKSWFGSKNTPEETLASLAQTNPQAIGEYCKGQAELIKAKVEQFNQDLPNEQVPEGVWKWIASLRELLEIYRGAIRPIVITIAFIHISYVLYVFGPEKLSLVPEWLRYQYEIAIGSWFGDRWK